MWYVAITAILTGEIMPTNDTVVIYSEAELCGSNVPKPPTQKTLGDLPPTFSEKYPAYVDRNTKIYLNWNRVDADSGNKYHAPSDPSQYDFDWCWRDGIQPPAYEIVQSWYWKMLQHVIIEPGRSEAEIKYSKTTGSSITDTETFSVELGLEAGSDSLKISSKLSASISHSVSIENSSTAEETIIWDNRDNKNSASVVIWQLNQEFSIVISEDVRDPNGKFFPKGTLLSEVMKPDVNGVTAYKSGMTGGENYGYVSCLLGRYTNALTTVRQVVYPDPAI